MWLVDDVEDRSGNGVVEPIDDTTIDHLPLSIALGDGRRHADVVVETEFAEHGVKQASPLALI
jgi:hypothetical protein